MVLVWGGGVGLPKGGGGIEGCLSLNAALGEKASLLKLGFRY